jgi:hypothetical protein
MPRNNGEVQMSEGFANLEAPFEDRRMWRLLLARLHPDAGGDHELFLFAHALKEGAYGHRCFESPPAPHDDKRRTERSADPFLRAWHNAMEGWASCNRDTLKGFALSEIPLAHAGD